MEKKSIINMSFRDVIDGIEKGGMNYGLDLNFIESLKAIYKKFEKYNHIDLVILEEKNMQELEMYLLVNKKFENPGKEEELHKD